MLIYKHYYSEVMDFEKLKDLISEIKIGETKTIYKLGNVELYVHRPEKVGRSVKQTYDLKKNFQIFMKKPGHNDFKPNHLRILINLHLKKESDNKSAEKVFDILEKVYDGEDPLKFEKELSTLNFRMSLDSALVDVCCAQLFMAEQEIAYPGGKVKPPRAYIMGYIRIIREGQQEIDKLLWNSIRHPPAIKYRFNDKNQKLQQ